MAQVALAGANDSPVGNQKLDFLCRFYPYAGCIPSHDALGDPIGTLDPELFKVCFVTWVKGLRSDDSDIAVIDDKTSRRFHARSKGRDPLHLVSA